MGEIITFVVYPTTIQLLICLTWRWAQPDVIQCRKIGNTTESWNKSKIIQVPLNVFTFHHMTVGVVKRQLDHINLQFLCGIKNKSSSIFTLKAFFCLVQLDGIFWMFDVSRINLLQTKRILEKCPQVFISQTLRKMSGHKTFTTKQKNCQSLVVTWKSTKIVTGENQKSFLTLLYFYITENIQIVCTGLLILIKLYHFEIIWNI